ncbi:MULTISPECIES: permease-like cell division protein FtsX [unclassified Colwellia]|jgi:cell division transport system permease protein|uniref:permease-like cell division protein FtsX n=1 Tax=unclassified Colwellia TaxID=196834 RepID=UPI0015F5B859|nr:MULTISPECIES: permease-like cell division protein FtsX [unclassified Colwellia]MBA6225598.1 cell division protein FtsX [Colwellia sp. MB3u-45]MBA6266846.1 cell division protein FtsX [Colwellia sp. MB3u-43]MBA6288204.1 cell division protein FtsX [Colwellia sp. MB3u-4]MBA6321758.1 cell division protein FtsX [Colwellia sp. MB02u-19]MBA6324988.1 cell division protein FtsX [Colwellia sp. MB02u-18]
MAANDTRHNNSQHLNWTGRITARVLRHLQQAIGSLGDLWRTPFTSVMTVLVLGISLTLPATLHLFVKNTQTVTEQWNSASEITLFLQLSTSDKVAQNLVQRIQLYPEVANVIYISAEQALTEFKVNSGFGQALEYLDENPLPATLLVTPTQRFSQAQAARELLLKLEQERAVDQGKLDLEWLTRLQAIAALIEDVVIGIAILLCLSVVLIIGNTIRLAILNQKDAIAVMKLVGATDDFIQRPFLYAGIWYGLLGGFVASICVAILASYISGALRQLTDLYQSQFVLSGLSFNELAILQLTAIGLGLLGSFISVRQHIRAIEPTAD